VKKRRRLGLIRLSVPERDRFGFSIHGTTILDRESDAERGKRVAAVKRLVADALATAVRQLGGEEALQLFTQAARQPPKKLGAPHKARAPRRDAFLLAEYDLAIAKGEGIGPLTKRLAAAGATWPDNSAGAIKKRIERLREKRDEQLCLEKSQRAQDRRRRMAARNRSNTILTINRGDKK
jgi:hypothetical protein